MEITAFAIYCFTNEHNETSSSRQSESMDIYGSLLIIYDVDVRTGYSTIKSDIIIDL
jgi:hypothetical protein